MENNNQDTNQQPTTQPTETGDKGRKMFTQEEVDHIVRERLNRARNKANEQDPTQAAEREAAYAEREAALTARESRMSCREYLVSKNYPVSLLDVVDTSNIDEFKKRADIAAELIRTPNPYDEGGKMYQPLANLDHHHQTDEDDPFATASKHTPKPY